MNFDETLQVVKKYNEEIIMFCTSFTFMFVPLLFVVSEALVLLLCSITKAFLYYGLCVNCCVLYHGEYHYFMVVMMLCVVCEACMCCIYGIFFPFVFKVSLHFVFTKIIVAHNYKITSTPICESDCNS